MMSIRYLKSANPVPPETSAEVAGTVAAMLARMAQEGEAAALDYASRLDGGEGPVLLSPDDLSAAAESVPADDRAAIAFAHENIRRFAEVQRASITDTQVELRPGLVAGQQVIPLRSAGCYVPGGRYAHIASALMTITTAKVAGKQAASTARRRPRSTT